MDEFDRLADIVNQHKGEIMGLACLVKSVLLATSRAQRAKCFDEFDQEAEASRVVPLNSGAPDAVLTGFDAMIRSVNVGIRQMPE